MKKVRFWSFSLLFSFTFLSCNNIEPEVEIETATIVSLVTWCIFTMALQELLLVDKIDKNLHFHSKLYSGEDKLYVLDDIPLGDYTLRVMNAHKDFRNWVKDVSLENANDTLVVNFRFWEDFCEDYQ